MSDIKLVEIDHLKAQLVEVINDFFGCDAAYCGVNPLDLATHLIANGVTERRWIPVTERLPTREDANETESILAVQKDEGYVSRWVWDIVARYPTEFTYWMPLPEPPKEEST